MTEHVPEGGAIEPPENEGLLSKIRDNAGTIALAGVIGVVAGVGGFMFGRKALDLGHNGTPIEHVNPFKRVTVIDDKKTGDSQNVRDLVFGTAHNNPQDIAGVVQPSDQDQLELFFEYNPLRRKYTQYPVPRVTELITINNARLFAQELKAHPNIEPFTIFNTTSLPVNLRYIRYVLHATKYWLNEHMHEGGDIEIGDHTLAKIKPIDAPHTMVIADNTPDFIKEWNKPATGGMTTPTPDLTMSYIMLNNAFGNRAYIREAIATEVCQSLVDVEDARPLFGGQAEEDALQTKISGFNPTAKHSLTMAAQESVCNGLGIVTAAAYKGSTHSVKRREASVTRVGLQLTPWISRNLYDADIPAFIAEGKRIRHDDNYTITTAGDNSPTIRYYRQHERP